MGWVLSFRNGSLPAHSLLNRKQPDPAAESRRDDAPEQVSRVRARISPRAPLRNRKPITRCHEGQERRRWTG